MELHRASAGKGLEWIGTSWKIYKIRPLFWVLFTIAYFIAQALITMIPLIGGIISFILGPAISGLAALAAVRSVETKPFDFGELLTETMGKMLAVITYVALLTALVGILIVIPLAAMGWNVPWADLWNTDSSRLKEALVSSFSSKNLTTIFIYIAYVVVAGTSVAMASVFAPALIFLKGVSPLEAFQLSLKCCLVNWLSLTIWGLASAVLALLSLIPLGLGLLITVPLYYIAIGVIVNEAFVGAPASAQGPV